MTPALQAVSYIAPCREYRSGCSAAAISAHME